MTNPDKATDATRVAIEFLTLWMEDDRESAARHIAATVESYDDTESTQAIAGLLNLNMFLIFELAKAHGSDDYRAWASQYLQHLSPRLPPA